MSARNVVLCKLLKIDREILLQQAEATSVEIAVSVDGGQFKVNLSELLFDEVQSPSIWPV